MWPKGSLSSLLRADMAASADEAQPALSPRNKPRRASLAPKLRAYIDVAMKTLKSCEAPAWRFLKRNPL